jgi:uncharacterized protein YecT (DUF1311 family)
MKILITVVLLSLFLLSAPANGQTEKYQCSNACALDKQTPYCLVAPKDAKLALALGSVKKRFASSTKDTLLATDLKMWFDVANDECKRTDTAFSGTVWTNTGEACILSTRLDILPGAKPIAIGITIPSKLQFTVVNKEVVTTFTVVNSLPYLRIDDPNLQADWGGAIRAVIADSNSVLFQVQRGCIKFPL